MTTTNATVDLDDEMTARLERLARARHRSQDGLMREAIEQYLDREERLDRFYQDGLAAWAEYQASGMHLSEDEADGWLAQLEAGEDVKPPTPHR
jgi:predicted transcriptional regulator